MNYQELDKYCKRFGLRLTPDCTIEGRIVVTNPKVLKRTSVNLKYQSPERIKTLIKEIRD